MVRERVGRAGVLSRSCPCIVIVCNALLGGGVEGRPRAGHANYKRRAVKGMMVTGSTAPGVSRRLIQRFGESAAAPRLLPPVSLSNYRYRHRFIGRATSSAVVRANGLHATCLVAFRTLPICPLASSTIPRAPRYSIAARGRITISSQRLDRCHPRTHRAHRPSPVLVVAADIQIGACTRSRVRHRFGHQSLSHRSRSCHSRSATSATPSRLHHDHARP
jgi:hypothetical protein